MMKKLVVIFMVLLFASCLKEEIPVPGGENSQLTTVAIDMGVNYKHQIFFDLSKNEKVEKNIKKIWDIGFETGENGWHIITNTSKYMFVFYTDKTKLSEVTNHDNCTTSNHHYDSPTGNLDSTGIGNWKDGKVRILDMGTTSEGVDLGWYKIKVDSVTSTTYYFKYAPVESTTFTTDSITKKEGFNFVYYSLKNKTAVDVAPPSKDWDLVFTQFIRHLTEPLVMDYLVTGCLSNRVDTKVALDTLRPFKKIDLDYALTLQLSSNIDAIGYDWKDIGLDEVMGGGSPEYTIYPNYSYVIKDQDGNYYKLRFIDFYSKSGEKGTPTFQYKKLN